MRTPEEKAVEKAKIKRDIASLAKIGLIVSGLFWGVNAFYPPPIDFNPKTCIAHTSFTNIEAAYRSGEMNYAMQNGLPPRVFQEPLPDQIATWEKYPCATPEIVQQAYMLGYDRNRPSIFKKIFNYVGGIFSSNHQPNPTPAKSEKKQKVPEANQNAERADQYPPERSASVARSLLRSGNPDKAKQKTKSF